MLSNAFNEVFMSLLPTGLKETTLPWYNKSQAYNNNITKKTVTGKLELI